MKIWRPLSLLLAAVLVTSSATAAVASANAPKKPTSESVAPIVMEAADENGFAQNLVYWAVQGSSVQVGLSALKGKETAALEKALGLRVRVVQESPIQPAVKSTPLSGEPRAVKKQAPSKTRPGQSPITTAATAAVSSPPLIDSPPYYGGDRIYRTQVVNGTTWVHQCTTGGVYTGSGNVYMSTAGHCGAAGTQWYQGYLDSDGSLYYSGIMGNATAVRWGGGDIDAAMISGGSYAASLWTSSTSALPQAGQAAVGVGTQVCADGSFTGLSCGGTVDLVDICVMYEGNVLTCGIDRASAPYRLVQHGDSGGPVFVNNGGSSASLAGIISGMSDSTGRTMYFTHINKVVNSMGVSVARY